MPDSGQPSTGLIVERKKQINIECETFEKYSILSEVKEDDLMITVSSLLDQSWHERYKRISNLNIRSSIYDVTNQCNLRCKGCFFFSSNEHQAAREEMDIKKWEAFIDREKERGVNLAILIGGEPTLYLDRVEAFYRRSADLLRDQRVN